MYKVLPFTIYIAYSIQSGIKKNLRVLTRLNLNRTVKNKIIIKSSKVTDIKRNLTAIL